jgi:two-component system cell cycle response regulator
MKPEDSHGRVMFSNLLDNPKLFRHVLEDLPVGIYIIDRERRIRFWNRRAEHLTGHLGQEVVGHVLEDIVRACDRWGRPLTGEHCPVTLALRQGQPQHCTAYYLHKNGHRVGLSIDTRAVLNASDVIEGAAVLLEEASVCSEELSGAPMYGCLDVTTGIPSHRLTRAVLNEYMAGLRESHVGFGVLRVRVLGLEESRAKHGPQSVAPFLRTAAHTLRHSLDPEDFLGCWGEHEFLAVLPTASPVTVATTAETVWNLLRHSEVLWWGDRFPIASEVACTMATPGCDLKSLLEEMKPSHSSATAKAAAAGAANDSEHSRG